MELFRNTSFFSCPEAAGAVPIAGAAVPILDGEVPEAGELFLLLLELC
jgi:hypothetical protein